MIILSHNFDFYRTLSSRLNFPSRQNKFHAIKTNGKVELKDEHYQKQPFKVWKNNLNDKKNIIALIPFIRNLIEYGTDDKKDYMFLTHLLHVKIETQYKHNGNKQSFSAYNQANGDFTIPLTHDITIQNLKQIFRKYIAKDNFNTTINDTDKVYDLIINIADTCISEDDINLENKIILALAIRLKAEQFMIEKIKNSSYTFIWKNSNGNQSDFLDYINNNSNQTRELFTGYSQIGDDESIKILDIVNIMTPENIHLNSFMYEPLLDMDIIELKELYTKVKNL
jgi:fructose-specific phosphotransferase system component IIB